MARAAFRRVPSIAAVFLFAVLFAAAFPSEARALQGVEEAVASVRSPEDIAKYFANGFTYTMNLSDRAHSPEETLESRTGDCDDFALLASAMLTRMDVENQVLVIRFRALSAAHAVCIWRGRDGMYNFISSMELVRTGQSTVEGAIKKFYPDCETIASIDPKMYVKHSGSGSVSSSKPFHGADLMTSLDPRSSIGL